jgi:hypothetical protein
MNLFFNSNSDASNSSVNSLTDNTDKSLPEFYLGDSLPLNITFTDGSGNYASWNGENNLSVKVAIGVLALNAVYVLEDQFIFTNNSYSSTLVLFTESMSNALNGVESIDAIFEVQVERENGQSITIHQSTITIQNQLIGSNTINPILDADADGVPNELESNDSRIDVSLNTLNSYVSDSNSVLQAGDIIKILQNIPKKEKIFTAGEYYKIYSVNASGIPKVIFENEEYYFTDYRGINWDKVVPAPDSDNDGVPDTLDAFPNNSAEQFDTDNDGVGNNADAFPQNPNESVDTDNDGVGDNSDEYPTDPFESRDTDNDGVGDNADDFPLDSTETTDTDGDGTGDNADAFPNDSNETADTDGDGTGDNSDAFPNDSNETADTDGDGVGDNADAFPNDASETTDTDNDGVGDNSDAEPNDPNITKSTEYFIYGDDGVNGTGYYYPVYTSTLGLSSYHTHTIQGVVVYMEDSNANHSQASLPANNTYIKVPNTTALDSDFDGVEDWADYFSNNASWSLTKSELDNYVVDANRPVASNLIVKILNNFTSGTGHYFYQGDYFVSTGWSQVSGMIKVTIDSVHYWLGNRGTSWEIVNPANNLYNEPDSDGDGVTDSNDAFPYDASETTDTDGDGVGDNSDAFPNDSTETTDTDGDGTGDNSDAFPNDSTEDTDTDGDGVGDNSDAFPNDSTEDTDTDGDGVGDNSDAFPNDSTEDTDTDGDGVGDNSDAFPDDSTEDTDTDGDGTGDNSDAFPNDSTEDTDTDGDGVGDNSDAFPNDPNQSADESLLNDFADKVYFGTNLGGFNYSKTFGEITTRYYNDPDKKKIDVSTEFDDVVSYSRTSTKGNLIDNSNNSASAIYEDVFPDPIWKMICTSVNNTSSGYLHSLKYGGSSVKDALPTEAGGTTAQNTLSEEITENIAETLGECVNHSEVLAGNVTDDGHELYLYIEGVQVIVSEFNTTNGTINFYAGSNLFPHQDECEIFKALDAVNPPAILKELYAPRAFYYDAVKKVYHNNSIADIISVDQDAYTLDIDTTGDGSADTTLDIEWGRKYDRYTEENALYDVTPAQVFKMKVTGVTSYTSFTNFKLANVDRDDYVIGANNAVNANPLMATGNLTHLVNGLDNDVAVLNSNGTITGSGKSLIMLVNGVQTSFDGFDNGGMIYIRKNTSNSTLLSVGDIVEIYIA